MNITSKHITALLAASALSFGLAANAEPGVGRGGREKEIEISGVKLDHYVGHRARMGRVLPDKLKPMALCVPVKPRTDE